ncbi:SGNH/GDSL hydrolase family protein [Fictibacillus fluitans]|uniref:SGNH/GDSL hydrolase family protein n=1 Tax=Fictibacillus fluitans TaxID=3058422 RepID=A0ABT8I016_9BACL|nr:SGNH/GDSL hydrolase family protein [Fictibacillus sp. NE201]MDN4526309.1 SGNH/GDSL hydrolase family protein [Fictibacillus sp. NE201]
MLKKSMLSLITAFAFLMGGSSFSTNAEPLTHQQNWMASWGTSQQMPYDTGISHEGFRNQTIRMVVNPNQKGNQIRLRFSNRYGTKPLALDRVVVSRSAGGADTVSHTKRTITFGGKNGAVIPVGEELASDAVKMRIKENKNLTVSVYTHSATGPTTWHSLAEQTTYVSDGGEHTAETNGASFSRRYNNWFWLEGLDVIRKQKKDRVIVALGDSITDGYGSTANTNQRWPDFLDQRLQDTKKDGSIAVINQGISGNKILRDSPIFGIKALDRFDHDVLEQPGVSDFILMEGINDIGHEPHEFNSGNIIAGMQQMIDKAHARGINVYGGTLTPFRGTTIADYFTEEGEQTRKEVNEWIRHSGEFDGVIDFDQMIRDPQQPERMLPAFDSGDHLHPNDAGYRAMAYGINLSLFK